MGGLWACKKVRAPTISEATRTLSYHLKGNDLGNALPWEGVLGATAAGGVSLSLLGEESGAAVPSALSLLAEALVVLSLLAVALVVLSLPAAAVVVLSLLAVAVVGVLSLPGAPQPRSNWLRVPLHVLIHHRLLRRAVTNEEHEAGVAHAGEHPPRFQLPCMLSVPLHAQPLHRHLAPSDYPVRHPRCPLSQEGDFWESPVAEWRSSGENSRHLEKRRCTAACRGRGRAGEPHEQLLPCAPQQPNKAIK